MSGGEKKKKGTRSEGWENAGSEFYQESYPGDGDMEILWKDPKRLATLLPSTQTRTVAATIRLRTQDSRANKATMRKHTGNRSRRESTVNRRASTVGGDHGSTLADLSEIESNEETAWREIMKLKERPIPMARKKDEKAKIMNEQRFRLQGFENFNLKRKKAWHRFMSGFRDSYQKLELWRRDLKHIEGHYGTGVVSFFRFIKWLFLLNLFTFSLVLLFIVLPTLLLDHRDVSCDNLESCFDQYFCNINSSNIYLSIAQGSGTLEKSHLFYGFYPNKTYSYLINNTTMYFNIPLAYILITIVYFLVSLIAIVRTGAKGFRERLIQGEGQFYQYSNLVFAGWDFCIHNEKSAQMKHRAIFNELKTLLEISRLEEEKQSLSTQDKWFIFFLRLLVNSIVLAILTVCGGAIYYVFSYSTGRLKDFPTPVDTETKMQQLLYEFLPSMCIVALNTLVPFIFKFLISYERYSPIMEIRMALIRTVFLRLASLLVFYASMYSKIKCDVNTDKGECASCNDIPCWETFVGQQIYKLLLTDFAIQLGVTFVVNFLRAFVARHVNNKFMKLIGEQSFDLPRHALDVVYTQSLCWVGIFFAPLMSAMACAVFFFIFYVKKFTCLVNCKPGDIVYTASRSTSLFMVVMLVSYPVALAPIALTMSEMPPSVSCGPFRALISIWSLVEQTFLDTPQVIQSVAAFFTTPGFAIPVFLALIMLLYYYTSVNSANRHMVKVLKSQLVLEGQDKKFLIDRLLMFIKQEKRARLAQQMMDADTITNASSIQS